MKKKVLGIVPVREFENTKLRLRKCLSKSERSSLSQALLGHVLRALQDSDVKKTLIVSSDRAAISKLVRKLKDIVVIAEEKHHGGVSSAVENGVSYCSNRMKGITSIMVLPSDLPLLSSKAINKAISKLRNYDLVIGPSSKLDGTSLLLFNVERGRIPFHYDDNSYRNHIKEAKRFKINYTILKSREFSFDIDTIDDVKKLMSKLRVGSFQDLLREIMIS